MIIAERMEEEPEVEMLRTWKVYPSPIVAVSKLLTFDDVSNDVSDDLNRITRALYCRDINDEVRQGDLAEDAQVNGEGRWHHWYYRDVNVKVAQNTDLVFNEGDLCLGDSASSEKDCEFLGVRSASAWRQDMLVDKWQGLGEIPGATS
jgi:hypothetical protein